MNRLILLFIISILIASCTIEEINRAKKYWNENIKNAVSPVCGPEGVCVE